MCVGDFCRNCDFYDFIFKTSYYKNQLNHSSDNFDRCLLPGIFNHFALDED